MAWEDSGVIRKEQYAGSSLAFRDSFGSESEADFIKNRLESKGGDLSNLKIVYFLDKFWICYDESDKGTFIF